jgi:hypothetical protein
MRNGRRRRNDSARRNGKNRRGYGERYKLSRLKVRYQGTMLANDMGSIGCIKEIIPTASEYRVM